MNPEEIIQQWMDDSRETLKNYDVEGHLNLISKDVIVHGVPELNTIDYKDWSAQVHHEFAERMIKSVDFDGMRIRAKNDSEIMFTTLETITATDGKELQNRLEVVLLKEEDGQWRVVQERLLDAAEFAHYHYKLTTQ